VTFTFVVCSMFIADMNVYGKLVSQVCT